MALTHRKLYTDPFYEATIKICKPYCNFITNPKGICPPNCFPICISSCKIIPPDVILFSAPPPPPPESPHHHLGISARFLISIVILVTLFLCIMLYKCYKAYRYRSRRLRTESQPQTEDTHQDFLDEDHGFVLDHPIWYIRTIGLQPSVISAITICKYKKGEGLVEGTECSVCLSEFQEDETLRLLPKCNHAFHIPCIDTWLRSHTNCPLCRAGIVSNVAVLPAPGQMIDDSNDLEEDENRRESERAESEGEPRGESERKGDEIELGNLDQLEVNEVVQPIRRSVSVDLSSAIPGEMVSVVHVNLGKSVGSCSSSAKSLEKEPDSMKRSFSCNGKVLFSKHNNSQRRS